MFWVKPKGTSKRLHDGAGLRARGSPREPALETSRLAGRAWHLGAPWTGMFTGLAQPSMPRPSLLSIGLLQLFSKACAEGEKPKFGGPVAHHRKVKPHWRQGLSGMNFARTRRSLPAFLHPVTLSQKMRGQAVSKEQMFSRLLAVRAGTSPLWSDLPGPECHSQAPPPTLQIRALPARSFGDGAAWRVAP